MSASHRATGTSQRPEAAFLKPSQIPAEVPYRFRNGSDTEDLRNFWTYASVDATRTMETVETRPVAAERAKRIS